MNSEKLMYVRCCLMRASGLNCPINEQGLLMMGSIHQVANQVLSFFLVKECLVNDIIQLLMIPRRFA